MVKKKAAMGCKEKSISWLLFLMLGSYKKTQMAGCITARMKIIPQYLKIYAYCAKIMLDFRKLLVVSYTLHYCGEVALLYPFLGNEAQRI